MLNWGIIGCGNVTELKSGPAFNKVPGSRLVAVMRRNSEKAKDYARRHGVPSWYDDAEALISDPAVNAIYIATPPLSHETYAIRALKAGKPVYLEKPMALDAAAAARIEAVARESGVKLTVAHYRRQQPLFLHIKSLLENEVIGKPRWVNLQLYQPPHSSLIAQTDVEWRLNPSISGGGLFHDLAPHQLDLMLYYLGEPLKVSGISFNAGELYQADDTVSGQMVFQNNILFNGTWCFSHIENRDHCEISGTKGKIKFSFFQNEPLVVTSLNGEQSINFEKLEHVQEPMIQKVTEYFLGKAYNPCPASDGVSVMRMIDAFTGKR